MRGRAKHFDGSGVTAQVRVERYVGKAIWALTGAVLSEYQAGALLRQLKVLEEAIKATLSPKESNGDYNGTSEGWADRAGSAAVSLRSSLREHSQE